MLKPLVLVGALIVGFGSSAQARSVAADRQEIIGAEDAWRKARIDGDTAFLERFYAKEGRIQGMDGKVLQLRGRHEQTPSMIDEDGVGR